MEVIATNKHTRSITRIYVPHLECVAGENSICFYCECFKAAVGSYRCTV